MLIEFSIMFKLERLYKSILDAMGKTRCSKKALRYLKDLKRLKIQPARETLSNLIHVALDGDRRELCTFLCDFLFPTSEQFHSSIGDCAPQIIPDQTIWGRYANVE